MFFVLFAVSAAFVFPVPACSVWRHVPVFKFSGTSTGRSSGNAPGQPLQSYSQ
ncbi:hypothetical protein BS47DRAFT_1355255 [Hydnum rufescens UP504]|uniref:Secreted protein n=1 Tax=Hydnum rufescens UP504 TaxID=1448309 RepID=A0A9P6AF25_9AGAM|nr:hypothetical protein BS47DRAFT_1355255 [Hydnum rufescens UP504]